MEDNKNLIIKSVAILGGVAVLAVVARVIIKKLKDKKKETAEDNVIADITQNDQTPAVNIEANEAKKYNPAAHVKTLSGYINDNWVSYYPNEVKAIVMSLSDAKLKKLNAAYKAKNGETLYAGLMGEYCWDYTGGSCYKVSTGRLKGLGLV
jgi:ABC-type lipoprotein release transport system permease subunit